MLIIMSKCWYLLNLLLDLVTYCIYYKEAKILL